MANSEEDLNTTSKVDFRRDEELHCCRDIYSSSLDPLPEELRKDSRNLIHDLSQSNAVSDGAKDKCTEIILEIEKALGPEHLVCDIMTRLLSERLRKLYVMEDALGLVRDRMERLKIQDFGSLQTLCRLHDLSGDYNKSSKEQQAALQLAKKMGDPVKISLAYAKLACSDWHMQNPEDARKKLKMCFDLLEDCDEEEIGSGFPKTESARWLIDTYKTIGYIHRLFNNHAKCAEYYLKALAFVERDETAIIELLKLETHIANDFSKCGARAKTQEYCDKAYDRVKKLTENEAFMIHHPYTVIHTLSRITFTLQRVKRDRVMDLRKELYSIGDKYLDKNHPIVGRLASDVALLADKLREQDTSTLYVQRAEAILEYCGNEADLDFIKTNVREISDTWNNLGKMYSNRDMLTESERCFKEGIAVNTRVYGINHPRLSRLYTPLGYLYKRFNNYHEAFTCFRKCMKISEEFEPNNTAYQQKMKMEMQTVRQMDRNSTIQDC